MRTLRKSAALACVIALVLNVFPVLPAAARNIGNIPYAACSDIELPRQNNAGESLTWSSDMPEIIDAEGRVTRPGANEDSATVTLTAVSDSGSESYEVLVPHLGNEYIECFEDDFKFSDKLDLSAIGNGELSFDIESGMSYMFIKNTQSKSSTVSVVLDEPVGKSGSADIELKIKPCAVTSVIFYSEDGRQVAKAGMHSSGAFMVAISDTGTQKNIGNVGTWLTMNYKFLFDSDTPKNSTFSLNVNDSVKYPDGTKTYRTSDADADVGIKKISIVTAMTDAGAAVAGTSVAYCAVREHVGNDTDAKVQYVYEQLDLKNADNITDNIELPSVSGGCEIVWASSDRSVIDNDGTVNLPEEGEDPKYAELTAFIICGKSILEKKFDITLNPYVDTRLSEDADMVDIPLIVDDDIILPDFKYGTKATFISDYDDVLSPNGRITASAEKNLYLPFKIRYENDTGCIERDYKTIVAKKISYLKMNMVYEDFEGITDPTDALFYINSGGESRGSAVILTDEISGSSVLSSIISGTSYSPEFRFNDCNGKVEIEFDVRMMCDTANFAYIYGDGICSSITLGNGSLNVRGAEQSIRFLENVSPDRWYHFKIQIDATEYSQGNGDCTTDIWVDNVKCVEGLRTRGNSTYINRILSVPQNIGGEMRYDNLKVYTDNSEAVAKAAEDLELPGADSVSADYTFPVHTAEGFGIEFVSENPEYITDSGKINRPEKDEDDKEVTVYGIVRKDTFMSVKPFKMTILHLYSDEVSVEKDTADLMLNGLGDVRTDLVLPTIGNNGSLITWQSSDESIINTNGKVTRPGYVEDGRYKVVTLTASIQKGRVSATKQFTAYVAENNYIKNAYVKVSSEDSNNPAVYINDEDYGTCWMPKQGGEITVVADLKSVCLANKCVIITKGKLSNASLSCSTDGSKYNNISITESDDGVFMADFDERAMRYIKLTANASADAGIAELELFDYFSDLMLIKKDIAAIKDIKLTNLTSDVSLPNRGENGSEISWKSSNTNAIDDSGRVKRQSDTASLKLTATFTLGNASQSVDFTASVKGLSSSSSASGGGGGGGGVSSGSKTGSSGISPLFSSRNQQTSAASGTGQETANEAVFNDLTGYDWAKTAIEALYYAGIVHGRGNNRFVPDDYVTRAEFVKLLCSVIDVPEGNAEFSDVCSEDWFEPYVSSAASAGWVLGSEGKFGPGNNITRQDMAVIIARAAELSSDNTPQFNDGNDISDYAQAAVAAVADSGIMQGYDGYFSPLRGTSRAEAAMVIYSLYRNRQAGE